MNSKIVKYAHNSSTKYDDHGILLNKLMFWSFKSFLNFIICDQLFLNKKSQKFSQYFIILKIIISVFIICIIEYIIVIILYIK